jgi:HKD family nuclease
MKRVCVVVIIFLAMAGATSGAERLLNYENRVVRAAEQVARIKTDREYSEEGVSYIKKLLPKTEDIEVEGRVVTVDNTWLHEGLGDYEKETDAQRRLAKLNETEGWLRELDEHLRRAESAPASESDASESREKLRSILARPEFQPEQETPLGRLVKEVRQRITNFLREIYSAFSRLIERLFGASAKSGWFSVVLIIALFLAAAYGVVRMAKVVRPRKRPDKKRRVLGEEIPAGATSRDLAEAALRSARAGDFRAGVRNLYLSLLCELSDRRLIELDESATNHEYLERVSSLASVASPMSYLTDRFDYFWYGKFPSTEEEFSTCLARYHEAMDQARALSQST